jgi:hypothetical protein
MEKRGDFRYTLTFRQHTLRLLGCATTHKISCSDVRLRKKPRCRSKKEYGEHKASIILVIAIIGQSNDGGTQARNLRMHLLGDLRTWLVIADSLRALCHR